MGINKGFIMAIAIFLIGLLIGFSLGFLYKSDKAKLKKLQNQLEKAKQLLPSISEIYSIAGTIKGIHENQITIESSPIANPFEELPLMRQVMITEKTRIIMQEAKDTMSFQKELEDYQKKLAQQGQSGNSSAYTGLPLPFSEKEIKISQLKAGDKIWVEADKNIKNMASFEATRVIVQVDNILTIPVPIPTNIT